MKIVEKAGGIVVNTDGDILVVTNITGRVTLPKGGLEVGESHSQAATREVLEEGGLQSAKLVKELGIIERPGFTEDNHTSPSVIKKIRMYLFTTQNQPLNPTVSDIIKAEWIKPTELKQYLTWQEEIDFFEQYGYQFLQKQLVDQLEQSFARKDYSSTVVSMQQNYENDNQLCLASVVMLPSHISEKIIEQISSKLKASDPAQYFYPAGSMHITIKNVRTIQNPPAFTKQDIEKAQAVFETVIAQSLAFDFAVEDVVLFPTSISVMAYSSARLQRLVLDLDQALKDAGVPDDKQYLSDSVFWGNITICRFTKEPTAALIGATQALRHQKIGSFDVNAIDLITCNAACSPASRRVWGRYQLK